MTNVTYADPAVPVHTITTVTTLKTVTIATTVGTSNTVNFICIPLHYFVVSKYLHVLTQFLAICHSVFGSFTCNLRIAMVTLGDCVN